eukprot:TRINITY_DN3911_c0_g2_i1.p1 TRINITY_DN3911_c0_g2~~TRINITY_DN3911_c0_g2_i1.p1  ORF type:complete len:829 (+),score=153.66 TRINITY_DN3911_c0_g2_i1:93-2579(+)
MSNSPGGASGSQAPSDATGLSVVLQIVRAELTKNFAHFGRMDPYAVVHWTDADGEKFELSKTRVDWHAHKTPHWHHACRSLPYRHGDSIEIQVFEAHVVGKASNMGSIVTSMDDIVGSTVSEVASSGKALWSPMRELRLKLKDEDTGHVYVQAMVVRDAGQRKRRASVLTPSTGVPSSMFETPVQRVGVSGGTAPFFRLSLCERKPGQSKEYFIGKDLSRASDEVKFYEEARQLMLDKSDAKGLLPLLRFAFEYEGILETQEEGQKNNKPLELLVLRNLHDGCTKLRLLDIKIGQKTAQAGWQGKSRRAAINQSLLDGITNSSCEGFRLEGFEGPPAILTSMDPLLDFGVKGTEKLIKKAKRIMLQRMTAAQILLYFLDLHTDLAHPDEELQTTLSQAETAELILHELMTKLAHLSVACHRSPVPQKWIGSSVALAFDAGKLPSRRTPQEEIRKQAVVSIFDWGRSELNTIERHNELSDNMRRDRVEYWQYYCGGIQRLSWEVARCYYHRFCNADSWSTVTFVLEDFDVMSSSDFMCKAEVPVKSTSETTVEMPINVRLLSLAHGVVANAESALLGVRPSLTYSIRWQEYPASSRLKGTWQVTLIRACNLPREDLLVLRTQSDPLVKVIAMSKSGHCFRQDSKVKAQTRDPKWNEVFELPVARSPHGLRDALASADLNCSGDMLKKFPPEKTFEEMAHRTDSEGLTETAKRTAEAVGSKLKNAANLFTHWEDAHMSEIDEALGMWESLLESAVASDQKASATPSTVQVNEESPRAETPARKLFSKELLDEDEALDSKLLPAEPAESNSRVMKGCCSAGCSDASECRIM